MGLHFFDASDSISIIGILAIFILVCNINHAHKGVAMWVLSLFVTNSHAETLNSRMSAATHKAALVASVNTVEPTT